jgi:membrane-associated phospholipid phosphatase
MSTVESWGIALVLALQQFSPTLDSAMRALSFLGEEEFFLVAIAFVYLCIDAKWGARLLGILIVSVFINHLVKLAFHAPRPYWIDPRVKGLSVEGGYGIPSGHAQNAVAFWGMNAVSIRRRWAWAGAAILVLAICISRVYLGVHFAHDILAGWLLGSLILFLFLRYEPRVAGWLRRQSPAAQIGVVVAVSAGMLALTLAGTATLAGVMDPPAWEPQAAAAAPAGAGRPAIAPRSLQGPFAIVGTFLGLALGLILNQRRKPFDVRGPWAQRLGRLVLTLVVLLVLRATLAVIFPLEPESVALLFRCVRYAIMGLWTIWLAPIVCIRVGLAQEQAAPA